MIYQKLKEELNALRNDFSRDVQKKSVTDFLK